MNTSIQILALCLAFVGSLTIAVALARVILEIIVGLMCRGLPTPHAGKSKGTLVSAVLIYGKTKPDVLRVFVRSSVTAVSCSVRRTGRTDDLACQIDDGSKVMTCIALGVRNGELKPKGTDYGERDASGAV